MIKPRLERINSDFSFCIKLIHDTAIAINLNGTSHGIALVKSLILPLEIIKCDNKWGLLNMMINGAISA